MLDLYGGVNSTPIGVSPVASTGLLDGIMGGITGGISGLASIASPIAGIAGVASSLFGGSSMLGGSSGPDIAKSEAHSTLNAGDFIVGSDKYTKYLVIGAVIFAIVYFAKGK